MAGVSLADRVRARVQTHLAVPFERRVRAPVRALRNAGRRYRPLFVTGASGSGTSLLAVALAQRVECAGLVYECDDQISHRSFLHVPTLARFRSVREYEQFIAPRADWSEEQGRADLQAMLRAYALRRGEVVVAKGPDIHLARAGFLHRCFPDAPFVAVFRDPVANVEGLRRKWRVFAEDSLKECIRFYRELHEGFLEQSKAFPERVLLVDYAELVAHSDEVLNAVARHLSLAASSRSLPLPDAPNAEGKGIRNVRGSRVEMVADADQRARSRLSSAEVTRIEGELADLHERMRRRAIRA